MARSCFALPYLLLHVLVVVVFSGRCFGEYNGMDSNHLCYCNANCPDQENNSSLVAELLGRTLTKLDHYGSQQQQIVRNMEDKTAAQEQNNNSLAHTIISMFLERAITKIDQQSLRQEQMVTELSSRQEQMDQMVAELSSRQEQMVTELRNETNQTNSELTKQTERMIYETRNQTQHMVSELGKQLQTMVDESRNQTHQLMTHLEGQQRLLSELGRKVSELNSTIGLLHLNTRSKPKDCAEIQQEGFTQNGVYEVFIGSNLRPVRVFCDLEHEGGGWLVFQRRKDGSQDFQQNWDIYTRGFGDLLGEFWLGNDFLHLLTEQKTYTLRVDMEDFDNGKRYAEYSMFTVGPTSDKFRLRLGDYSGDAGDSMTYHSGRQFSTIDQDNDDYDSVSCSSAHGGGGGWWYSNCLRANLNGLYLRGQNTAHSKGVLWRHWRGYDYSLKTTVMKLRPANY